MRCIIVGEKKVDMTFASELSTNWDKKYAGVDTEYCIINCSVLGVQIGRESLDVDDVSSAWAAVHGRKYNNGRIAIPFSREFVSKHLPEIEEITRKISLKCSGGCLSIQKHMTEEEKAKGRETAMRMVATREARSELMSSGAVIDSALFAEANRPVRAEVPAKVVFNYGVSVSARRVADKAGLQDKKQFTKKDINIGSGKVEAYVTTMDEKGLKKVPIMKKEARDAAEELVYSFACVAKEALKDVVQDPTDEGCLKALKYIADNMPGEESDVKGVPEYTDEEKVKIEQWKNEIISRYMSTD